MKAFGLLSYILGYALVAVGCFQLDTALGIGVILFGIGSMTDANIKGEFTERMARLQAERHEEIMSEIRK